MEQHKAQDKSVLENENIKLPDSSANNHHNNQPGTSSSTPGSNKSNCTFEELLLETVKQAPSEPKKAKKGIGKGAEVITCIEHSNQTISTTKSLTENGNNESELSDPVYEDDDDIVSEMKRTEDLEKCVEERSRNQLEDDYIQTICINVVSTEDKLVEVKFAKIIPSLNPQASTYMGGRRKFLSTSMRYCFDLAEA
ncbi:hypothetical protein FQA39_LY15933 [Lamprigera yunnana]|nr:hypothetical protein FQA39_LY15933 [Lamprigera yunnana]